MTRLAGIVFTAIMLVSCTGKRAEIASDGYPIMPVDLTRVKLTDHFWLPKIERNRLVTIPYAFGKCEETGRIDNFAVAGGLKQGTFTGERYNDSDVYKIIEGACYSLMQNPDPRLQSYVDSLVVLIAAAQEDDGYLYTARTISTDNPAPGAGRDRWIDVWVSHELYNIGHMYEAAVAHFMATGRRDLLDVAVKSANLVYDVFGWGKREAAPGHQEIEIGLIKLNRVTGDPRYLELAQFFLDVRGKPQEHLHHEPGTRFAVYNDVRYLQQHKPVLEQDSAVGHAVRGAYMYTGMADLSARTSDDSWLKASQRIWRDVTETKIYITGGIGSKEYGEAFGDPFHLPNMTAYTETCASVANVFWNDRLFRATGEGKYIDILERTLYNGLISGIGADGMNFFYPNPLESDGSFQRSGWFDCSCCPGNVARFMPYMASYIYSFTDEEIYVNLFAGSEAEFDLRKGSVKLVQETDYPWSGKSDITVETDIKVPFTIKVRIPSWTGDSPFAGGLYYYADKPSGQVVIKVNGVAVSNHRADGYASIERRWRGGDIISVEMPFEARRVVSNPLVKENSGRMAFERGPVVYCLEEADNGKVRETIVSPDAKVAFEYRSDLMGGLGTLRINGKRPDGSEASLVAVPYFSWANRGAGEMIVWVLYKV